MHLSLKKRIILFFLLAMMLMVGFFALYFYQSTRELMAQSEMTLEAIVSKSIEKEIAAYNAQGSHADTSANKS